MPYRIAQSNQLLGCSALSTLPDGSITEIVTGFGVNNGAPGGISAPAGLTYDSSSDTLYVIDTNANRVVAITSASLIGTDGIVVSGSSFTGNNAASAKIIASGAPLNGPISSALLANGNLIVGNTLDPNGTNLLIEISPSAGVVATKNVDTGAGGAIFGIVATQVTITVPSSTPGYNTTEVSNIIYFNDDNANTVVSLSSQ